VQGTLNNNGESVAGQIIVFDAGFGSLSATSKLTNRSGVAEVLLFSDVSNVGASSLIATFNSATTGTNYEFLTADIAAIASPSINVIMQKDGQRSVRFKADEQVQLQSTLIDQEDLPLEDVIVSFVTGKGVLNTNDALTDSRGIAQVSLVAEPNELYQSP
jgi:hypothetical protein